MVQTCPNCGEEIQDNFDLHYVFCSRHRIKCDICHEVVMKNVYFLFFVYYEIF